MLPSSGYPREVIGHIPLILEGIVILKVISIPNLVFSLLGPQDGIILVGLDLVANIPGPQHPAIMILSRSGRPIALILPQNKLFLFPPYKLGPSDIGVLPVVIARTGSEAGFVGPEGERGFVGVGRGALVGDVVGPVELSPGH